MALPIPNDDSFDADVFAEAWKQASRRRRDSYYATRMRQRTASNLSSMENPLLRLSGWLLSRPERIADRNRDFASMYPSIGRGDANIGVPPLSDGSVGGVSSSKAINTLNVHTGLLTSIHDTLLGQRQDDKNRYKEESERAKRLSKAQQMELPFGNTPILSTVAQKNTQTSSGLSGIFGEADVFADAWKQASRRRRAGYYVTSMRQRTADNLSSMENPLLRLSGWLLSRPERIADRNRDFASMYPSINRRNTDINVSPLSQGTADSVSSSEAINTLNVHTGLLTSIHDTLLGQREDDKDRFREESERAERLSEAQQLELPLEKSKLELEKPKLEKENFEELFKSGEDGNNDGNNGGNDEFLNGVKIYIGSRIVKWFGRFAVRYGPRLMALFSTLVSAPFLALIGKVAATLYGIKTVLEGLLDFWNNITNKPPDGTPVDLNDESVKNTLRDRPVVHLTDQQREVLQRASESTMMKLGRVPSPVTSSPRRMTPMTMVSPVTSSPRRQRPAGSPSTASSMFRERLKTTENRELFNKTSGTDSMVGAPIHYVAGIPHIGYGHKLEDDDMKKIQEGINNNLREIALPRTPYKLKIVDARRSRENVENWGITKSDADRLFTEDFAKAERSAREIPNFEKYPLETQQSFIEMSFQLGGGWFKRTSKNWSAGLQKELEEMNLNALHARFSKWKVATEQTPQRWQEHVLPGFMSPPPVATDSMSIEGITPLRDATPVMRLSRSFGAGAASQIIYNNNVVAPQNTMVGGGQSTVIPIPIITRTESLAPYLAVNAV